MQKCAKVHSMKYKDYVQCAEITVQMMGGDKSVSVVYAVIWLNMLHCADGLLISLSGLSGAGRREPA